MYVELIVDPAAEVWYGLIEYQWEEPEVEYEEPEFKIRRFSISKSAHKKSRDYSRPFVIARKSRNI